MGGLRCPVVRVDFATTSYRDLLQRLPKLYVDVRNRAHDLLPRSRPRPTVIQDYLDHKTERPLVINFNRRLDPENELFYWAF